MATYSYVTNATQDKAITAALATSNAQRAAILPVALPAQTAAQFLLDQFTIFFTQMVNQNTTNNNVAVQQAWLNASPATQATAAAALGVTLT